MQRSYGGYYSVIDVFMNKVFSKSRKLENTFSTLGYLTHFHDLFKSSSCLVTLKLCHQCVFKTASWC